MNDESLGIVALVCGLVSIFLFPIAFGGAAIIVGLMVMGRNDSTSRAYANARIGLIAGIIGIVLWIVTLVSLNMIGFDANSLINGSLGGDASNSQPAF